MKREILIEHLMGETRLALLEDGELAEMYTERMGQEKLSGNVYVGRVENILPGMNAAFVDIGLEKNGFLYAGDIMLDTRGEAELAARLSSQRIENLLHRGQQILVQVVKEPGGTKGPRVSSHVTLPGRKLVLLPTVRYCGVSKRIEEDEERFRLRSIAEELCAENGMGLIVRTAARDASREELSREFGMLRRLWEGISHLESHVIAPKLIHRDDSLIYRAVRDMLDEDTMAIRTESEEIAKILRAVAETLTPEYAGRIVRHEGDVPLFDLYRVDSQAEKALARKVWLKSGGYLVLDETEALTVIDVNTGKFVGKKSLSETVYRTNCEAAKEIARQLRLRDIGGIIVIDFIDMDLPEQRDSLLEVFRESMKSDRNRTNIAVLTSLGLLEMTRKKVRQPLSKQLMHCCDACGGSGHVPTYETVARKILRDLYRRRDGGVLLVDAPAAAATVLLGIGAPRGVSAYVYPNPARQGEDYEISPADMASLPKKAQMLKQG